MKNSDKVSMKGVYDITIRDAKTGAIKREYHYENLIPTVGRALLANQLTDTTPTNNPWITHCALGSSSTAAANSDTQLGTETYRNAIASMTNASNIGYATGFFSASETSGTYREMALFSAGTGSANSGVLISRVIINITKSTSETLTADWTITFS